jgi:transcriptional regulator with XRE-family HTH domain
LKELGEKLRQLREGKRLLLRQVAADLDMDTALLSKIERGDRSPKKEQLLRAADIFGVPSRDLLVLWLAEKITQILEDEPLAMEALDKCRNQLKKEKANNG